MAVPHWCGIIQLPFCGINGNKFSWFENYLFNQKQHVLYNGHLSEAFSVFRGVPQRSILSPTLFYLIWMILITVYTILVKYSLNLKKDKVETMIFGTSICVKKAAPLNIQIKGTSINQTSYKYLGTHLDSTLALNGDFNSKYRKLSSRLQLLSKLRPNLNVKAAKLIYTKSKFVKNTAWKTWLNSRTSCWYHHLNQYSEINTNNDLYMWKVMLARLSKHHNPATNTYA